LVLAALVGSIARLLKQPLIVAFIIVGILAGPTGLGLVSSEDEVRLLAKLGIAILLFLVGLKLDIHLIRATGLVALLTGIGQVVFTSLVGFLIVVACGFDVIPAMYIAVALTFSSTIIIVKLLGDKRELDTLHGRIAVGFLIVQDILVVIAMVVIVTIGQPGETSAASELLTTFLGSVAFLAAVALLSRYVIPKVLNWMASSPELTLLFGVAWAVALAAISALLGLSMEIGAFVAGGVARVDGVSGKPRGSDGEPSRHLDSFFLHRTGRHAHVHRCGGSVVAGHCVVTVCSHWKPDYRHDHHGDYGIPIPRVF